MSQRKTKISKLGSVVCPQQLKGQYLRFVPCLHHVHIAKHSKGIKKEDGVHFVEKHWAAALFFDISGFTRLSQSLGAEKTKKHCNIYFNRVLGVVAKHFGDVYKFLGDAVLDRLHRFHL